MSTKTISYIAVISIFLVFLTQTFLVVDYFNTVRLALIRESDAILRESFRMDLNKRNIEYNEMIAASQPDSIVADEQVFDDNEAVDFDMRNMDADQGGLLNRLDIFLNEVVSLTSPMNLANIDSITGEILKSREIYSDFLIQIIEPQTGSIITGSKEKPKSSLFEIPSQPYPLDFENKQALRLILINPFSLIIKRMGLMLIASILFSVICLLAFRFLIQVLAKQKQLVKFKNEFLSNIAHELKRPVSSLLVNMEALEFAPSVSNDKYAGMMLKNSVNSLNELKGTISMIVGLAKVEEGLLVLNKIPVDPVMLLEDLRMRFISSPAKKVKIETNFEVSDIIIQADELMLTQCFANLIDNAIKYSHAEVLIVLSLVAKGSMIEVSIKDNGIGIPAEKIGTIFDKYSRVDHQTKVGGFGIGLNYVKTIIEKHGGNIRVMSEPGVGSEFIVSLPKK
jgi:two-component system, OmpR family, phosphate regulon sensor histidine kinase PhoR